MGSILNILRQMFTAFRWWFVVMPWEQAVRVTLGKKSRVCGPGLHLRLPFVHSVYKQSVRLRAMSMPTQTLTSFDGRTITLSASLGFAIVDIQKLYATLHDTLNTLTQLAEIAIASYVVGHPMEECSPKMICAAAVKEIDLSRFGLGEVRLSINSFAEVKTYRLISDQRYTYGGGDMDTSREEGK